MCLCTTVHRCLVRMPWLLHYLFLLLPLAMSMVAVVDSGKRLPSVYWNSSNPMFLISNNDHVIDVKNNDQIEIVCPRYDSSTPEYKWEYYIVYMVKESEYNACRIFNRSEARLIVNCSAPLSHRIFTLNIVSFGGIPNMPDYHAGENYYFISTSSGRKGGLANQVEGACHNRGMKMMVRVCCSSTAPTKTPSKRPTTSLPDNRPPSVRTTPRTTRRPTQRPTTTRQPTRRTTTTEKPTPPDYNTKDKPNKNQGPGEKMPDVIHDSKERNSGLINISKTTCPQIDILLLTVLLTLLCLLR